MSSVWKSGVGKLVLGGCGTQLGVLIALGSVTILSLFCVAFVVANVLSIGLARGLADQPEAASEVASATVSTAAVPAGEVNLLHQQVDLLLGVLDTLGANAPAVPLPADNQITSDELPLLMANQSGVNLHSGPAFDTDVVGALRVGDSLDIIGRNSDSTWWLVATPDGLFAWVADSVVATFNVTDTIPVVMAPSQLGEATATPTAMPTGTPTPAADVSRKFVEDELSYQKVTHALYVPPVSSSFSPDGSRIAVTERIKLYSFLTDGAHTDILFEDDDKRGPLGWVVWSPDGEYIAFEVGFKNPKCKPCESVALLHLSDNTLTYLKGPDDMDTDAPRWTQDGRLLVNVHPGEPADGVAYIYNVFGEGKEASGTYVLSTSHEGQKWFPWRPGRIWRAGVSERPDSYVNDL